MMTMMTPLGGWRVWDLNDDVMTQHSKVAATMICHPLLIICVLKLTVLASTNLNIIATFDAGPRFSPSWAVAGSILS